MPRTESDRCEERHRTAVGESILAKVVGGQGLAYGGIGVDTRFCWRGSISSGGGVYAEGFLSGRGGGLGAYFDGISTNAGCAKSKAKSEHP